MFSIQVRDVYFGTCVWSFHLSDLQVCCSLQGQLMLFLSCKTSHVALSQGFLAKGWMSLSDTFGGPYSNTHVYREEKIIMRTWGRWMKLWPVLAPSFTSALIISYPIMWVYALTTDFPPFSLTKAIFPLLLWYKFLPCYSLLKLLAILPFRRLFLYQSAFPESLPMAASDSLGKLSLKLSPTLFCYSELTLF